MKPILLSAAIGMLAMPAPGGERIAGTNSYVLNEEQFPAGLQVYWMQDNQGTYEVTEGPLESGFVRCVGAGFANEFGPNGKGVCVFGFGEDTFTWTWQNNPGAPNTWVVSDATGKYTGMKGHGTARTRVETEFRAMIHRVTDWEGEITLPQN